MIEESSDSPFMMYINYQDLHYPYHSDEWDNRFIEKGYINSDFFKIENRQAIIRQYANAAHHLDQSINELFDKLVQLKIMEDTVVVIVGDHPDSFYENGILGHAWIVDKYQRQTPFFLINGKGNYYAPFGQDDIYNMIINSSIDDEPDTNAKFDINKEKTIFLIAGNLKTPRTIGFIGVNTLETYSFTTGKYISKTDYFKKLITYWEQLLWHKTREMKTRQNKKI